MRLLRVDAFSTDGSYLDESLFCEFYGINVPLYAIASHRWCATEPTYKDIRKRRTATSPGFRKLQSFCTFLQNFDPSVKWLWIDTCCIDKSSSAELTEAINSMYRYYRRAKYCLAFLSDYPHELGSHFPRTFTDSEWFTRGWTLQELVAPKTVIFVDQSWSIIGCKGPFPRGVLAETGRNLTQELAIATGISTSVLLHQTKVEYVSVDDKLSWMSNRQTTRVEDMAYCLLGLFDVSLPLIYGEGEKAWTRLLEEIEANSKRARSAPKRKRMPGDVGPDNRRRLDYRALTKRTYGELLDDGASVASLETTPVKQCALFEEIRKHYRQTLSHLPSPERVANLLLRSSNPGKCSSNHHNGNHKRKEPHTLPIPSEITKKYWTDQASSTSFLRQSISPLWKDAAAASPIQNLEDGNDQDRLCLLIAKFYHQSSRSLISAERFSNLSWRMLAWRRTTSDSRVMDTPAIDLTQDEQPSRSQTESNSPVNFERDLDFSDSE